MSVVANRMVVLPSIVDEKGALGVVEALRDVPFEIKRIYFITSVSPGISRGFHAHKNLHQLAVCLKGSCRFVLDDGKGDKVEYILDHSSMGLLITNVVWREMHDFTSDCVLVVLASEYYEESDYIRDYEDFLRFTNG